MSTPLLGLALLALSPLAPAREPGREPGRDEPARCLRLHEEGDVVRLQVAVRRFAAPDGGPEIVLAPAVHIAERRFFEALQARLDGLDLVLFEGVRPPGTGDPAHDLPLDDAQRVAVTRGRIRWVAASMHRYRDEHGAWPADLGALAQGLPPRGGVPMLGARSLEDAWGRQLLLTGAPARGRRTFDVQSLGADGRVGGSGADADLCFADQADLSESERGTTGGLQADIAEALGLVFQLDALRPGERWQNSDLALDQVEARLARAGLPEDDLLSSLRGLGFAAKAAGFALDLLSRFSAAQAALKLVGVELLARADELVEGAPPEARATFEVLLHERNAVVLSDLRAALAQSSPPRAIGVVYGAAHVRDLEARLRSELRCAPAGEEWLTAVELDLGDLGLPVERVRWLRGALGDALERQLRAR